MMGRERQRDCRCDLLSISTARLISISVIPALLQDIIGNADKWGNSGRIDPFSEIFDVSTHTAFSIPS